MVPDGLGGGLGRSMEEKGMRSGSHPMQPNRATDLCFSLNRNQSCCHSVGSQVSSCSRSTAHGKLYSDNVALESQVSAWERRTPDSFLGFTEPSLVLSSLNFLFGESWWLTPALETEPGERRTEDSERKAREEGAQGWVTEVGVPGPGLPLTGW